VKRVLNNSLNTLRESENTIFDHIKMLSLYSYIGAYESHMFFSLYFHNYEYMYNRLIVNKNNNEITRVVKLTVRIDDQLK